MIKNTFQLGKSGEVEIAANVEVESIELEYSRDGVRWFRASKNNAGFVRVRVKPLRPVSHTITIQTRD